MYLKTTAVRQVLKDHIYQAEGLTFDLTETVTKDHLSCETTFTGTYMANGEEVFEDRVPLYGQISHLYQTAAHIWSSHLYTLQQ